MKKTNIALAALFLLSPATGFAAKKNQLPPMSQFITLSLQKKAIRLNNQGKTMIAKDSFVPLL